MSDRPRPLARLAPLLAGVAALALVAQARAAPASADGAGADVHRFHADHVLGASLDVTVVGASATEAARAAAAAQAEIARLDAVLSGWRADSALAALNAGGAAHAPELLEAAAHAERWRALTGGAFDPRLGEVAAGRRAGDAARVRAALAALAAAPGPALDGAGRLAPGVALDLDGAGKGYVIDRALAAARAAAPGARGLLLDLGGDLRAQGEGPNGGAWRVGLARGGAETAEAVLRLPERGGAVAMSGAGERDLLDAWGRPQSHLTFAVDGAPAPRLARAAVLAPCAADADALATALCLMLPSEGLALAEGLPGVEAQVTGADGVARATSGWAGRSEPAPRLIRAAAPAGWPAGQAVTVTYEVPKIAAPKYYAPYLVIWITDANHDLVRTLTLLGQKPRYLESNYVWWRRYGRSLPNVDALAKPTRAPGRYTATWDGATDAGGRAPAGRYTVHVEAARQDGGHTYETLEVTVGAGGSVAVAQPKDELGALKASVGPAGRPA